MYLHLPTLYSNNCSYTCRELAFETQRFQLIVIQNQSFQPVCVCVHLVTSTLWDGTCILGIVSYLVKDPSLSTSDQSDSSFCSRFNKLNLLGMSAPSLPWQRDTSHSSIHTACIHLNSTLILLTISLINYFYPPYICYFILTSMKLLQIRSHSQNADLQNKNCHPQEASKPSVIMTIHVPCPTSRPSCWQREFSRLWSHKAMDWQGCTWWVAHSH